MRRDFANIILAQNAQAGFRPGDEAAHRAAAALADRFDAPTIIALTDAVTFLERMGGQLHVVTLRERIDQEGNMVEHDAPGSEWLTLAFHLRYETQDARVALAKPPESILGVPVTDMAEPPMPVAAEPAESLRDEIEAEAEALGHAQRVGEEADFEEPAATVQE